MRNSGVKIAFVVVFTPFLFMSKTNTKYTSQHIDNQSFDDGLQVSVVLPVEYDPSGSAVRKVTGNLASKTYITATEAYTGEATIGSATSAAVWRVSKTTLASPFTTTWAGGGAFNQIMDDYLTLTYL